VRTPPKRKPAVSSKRVQLNTFQKRDCKVASELNTIHSANMQYWTCGAAASSEERAAYQRRLGPGGEEIRAALAEPLFGHRPIQLKCTQRRIQEEGT
jgi:hypothetical protein